MRTQCGHCTEVHTTLAAVQECARQHGFRTTIPGQRAAAFEPSETAAHARQQRAALTEADLFPGPGQQQAAPQEPAGAAPRPQAGPPADAWKSLTAGKYNVPEVGIVIVRISSVTDLPYASTRNPDSGELEYRKGLIRTMLPSQKIEEPQTTAGRRAAEPEAGFYMIDGAVHKVQRAVHGSGFMYAKKLDLETGQWERARGAVTRATEENRLTPEQALEVAKECQSHTEWALYGHCFICGRTLTDEESIGLGIGPVCYGKLGAAA